MVFANEHTLQEKFSQKLENLGGKIVSIETNNFASRDEIRKLIPSNYFDKKL